MTDHIDEIAERVYYALQGRMLATARDVKALQVGAVVYLDVTEQDWSQSSYEVTIERVDAAEIAGTED